MKALLHRGIIAFCMLLAAGSTSALASGVDLCDGAAGWRADWDNSLDSYVQVIASDCFNLGTGRIFIEKSAQFTNGPVNGVIPPIVIVFSQTRPTSITRIVIDDEIITNSTGIDWTAFSMNLIDTGDAVFDPAATLASGGPPPIGFSISPFTTASFSSGDTRLDIGGGVVPNNSHWFPGGGLGDGQLHIVANPHATAPFTTFTLKEMPFPEPSSLVLLAAGLITLSRRRRNRSR